MSAAAARTDVAIIGVACRCPSAPDARAFWRLLVEGRDTLRPLAREELEASTFFPVDPGAPEFVGAAHVLDGVELFDAAFFGIPGAEAELMDPQHRCFLECAWEAVEDAGYDAARFPGSVSVYAGCGLNTYMLLVPPELRSPPRAYVGMLGTDKDYLATRVSYKLDLRGESLTVQTACSTGLVAVHLACQSLITGQSDMALAGASAILLPQRTGYLHHPEMVLSPDGHCRAFDRDGRGFADGRAVGAVLLKPLDDALRDRDHVYAVIKGSAINNDGAKKLAYTAPGVDGQAAVISMAQEFAGVSPDSITYVEAHATGTPLGDPIEVAALTQAFATDRRGYCALGSVKTNIGHCDVAAGIMGLIKTALALQHRQIPPTVHFQVPNPAIDFARTPFYVADRLLEWQAEPRRAGVSAFGFGGTNAHVVLEEAPAPAVEPAATERPLHVLTLSARSESALRALARRYEARLAEDDVRLADVCFTANTGRGLFKHRLAVVGASGSEVRAALGAYAVKSVAPGVVNGEVRGQKRPRVAFVFTEEGAPEAGMAADLPQTQPTFRRALERCGALDLDTAVGSRAGFAVGYALAALWRAWGVRPDAVLGRGVGEQVAACVAGALEVEEALGQLARPDGQRGADGHAYDPAALAAGGFDVVIEIGPPELPAPPPGAVLLRSPAEWRALLGALAAYHVGGGAVDWSAFDADYPRGRVSLPTYPFERQPYWVGTKRTPAPVCRPPDAAALYQVRWRPAPPPAPARPPAGPWLVLRDELGIADRLAAALAPGGEGWIEVVPGAGFAQQGPRRFAIDPACDADYEALARALGDAGLVPRTVLHLWSCTGAPRPIASLDDLESRQERGVLCLFALTRALAARFDPSLFIQLVTSYAQDLGVERPVAPEHAPLWGLGRTIPREHLKIGCGGIDLETDGADPGALAALVLRELGQTTWCAYHHGERLAAELEPVEAEAEDAGTLARDGAVYLVTGGTGGVGLAIAAALARAARVRLALLARTPVAEDGDTARALRELERIGAEVMTLAADVANPDQVRAAVLGVRQRWGRIDVAIHAAGVAEDRLLREKSSAEFRRVLRPKVAGTWALDQALADEPLDLFALFSSIVTLPGGAEAGTGDYAAANAFLDAFPGYRGRRAAAASVKSLRWSIWDGVGMGKSARLVADAKRRGLRPLSAGAAVDALGVAARLSGAHYAVLGPETEPARAPAVSTAHAEPGARLVDAARRWVRERVAASLKVSPAAIDPGANFQELGFDSLVMMETRQGLEDDLGVRLEPVLLFECPSVRALATHLLAEHRSALERVLGAAGEEKDRALAPPPPATERARPAARGQVRAEVRAEVRADDVAVIGIACRFPGADDPEAFWTLLRDGKDAVGEVPRGRFGARERPGPDVSPAEEAICRQGGFLADASGFDPLFFSIAPVEAKAIDPMQKLFLEVVWEALEDAGYAGAASRCPRTGVFVGVASYEYTQVLARAGLDATAHAGPGTALSVIANRPSYCFDWTGPSLAIDTACSSSLVALDLACRHLRLGLCDQAIAGGVNVLLSPAMTLAFQRAGMLSPTSRCRTFSADADGYVRGEGAGAVLLKPLRKAVEDGDTIHAVIRGSAVNHDGRSKVGLTAPNPKAQTDVILAALDDAGLAPDAVSYVEAHGTGTPLGDAIELRGLGAAFGAGRREPCLLGSVKTNLGHLEAAAGIAGLIKVILAMKHRQLPPSLHFTAPNPHVGFEKTPFVVNTELCEWRGATPLRAGVSSFGYGGANAHVVVEEAPPRAAAPADGVPYVLPLSARSAAALRRLASAYRTHLAVHPELTLRDVCFTAGVGRAHLAHRLALVARDREQLLDKLRLFELEPNAEAASRVHAGVVADPGDGPGGGGPLGDAAKDASVEDRLRRLDQLARAFVAGEVVDWAALCDGARRVSLPTYPFERQPCWFETPAEGGDEVAPPAVAAEDVPSVEPPPLWRPTWTPARARPVGRLERGRVWLVFGGEAAVTGALEKRLRDRGQSVVLVRIGSELRAHPDGSFELAPSEPRHYELLLRTLAERGARLGGVLYLQALAGPPRPPASAGELEARVARDVEPLFFLVRAMLADPGSRAPGLELHVATGHAQSVREERVAPERALLWGLVRTIRRECPELRCALHDFEPAAQTGAEIAERLLDSLGDGAGDDERAYRGTTTWVHGLAPVEPPAAGRFGARADGFYVVTGGLGGIGLAVARFLVERGARALALVGRTGAEGLDEGRRAAIEALERRGARVEIVRCDVADHETLARELERLRARHGAVRGLVHAAGVLEDGLMRGKTVESFRRVLRPKVTGSLALAQALAHDPLDFAVLCSSVTALLGNTGQSDYAAANAFLDALPASGWFPPSTISIAWGLWSEVGMGVGLAEGARDEGLRPLATVEALAALEAALRLGLPCVAVGIEGDGRPADRAPAGTDDRSRSATRNQLADFLAREISQTLEVDPDHLDEQTSFVSLGVDSILAVRLARQLERAADVPLGATLFFDYPTIAALAAYLHERHADAFGDVVEPRALPGAAAPEARATPAPPSPPPPPPAPALAARPADDVRPEVAIIGAAGRFPGAPDLETFWQNLRDGVDSISEVSPERWGGYGFYDPDPEAPGKSYSKWGGFLSGVADFDPLFFQASPREAEQMDPQQRLFLEVAWEALEDAGYAGGQLAGTRTGVYVGAGETDYASLHDRVDAHAAAGSAASIVANRTSYFLDLKGPSVVVDTACSSSLVALHLACQSLRSGECEQALVGGVTLHLSPRGHVVFSKAHMLSRDGRCKTFDADADGYSRGEGVVALLLKPLARALADGDRVLAVIKGSAVGQDGRTVGLSAPSGPAQTAVLREAFQRAGVEAETISYVEAHGTGTALGDPIEVTALKEAFKGSRVERPFCALGSVKTNIGHLEFAAGLASVVKVVLALQHRQIPPTLHFKKLNPYIDLSGSPFFVADRLLDWQAAPRRAGVSAFGFGGTNAHVVLEEAPAPPPPAAAVERPLHVLTLSARSESALQVLARRYEACLARDDAPLPDVCFTANTGRGLFKHRLAVVGASAAEVRAALGAYAAGRPAPGLVSGEVRGQKRPKVAFVFTGHGAQEAGMAASLHREQPTFRRALEGCEAVVREILGVSLLDTLYGSGGAALEDTAVAQPALFAVGYALAELWRSWGVRPDAVLGHDVGEYVAACVAGALAPEEALRLVALRGHRDLEDFGVTLRRTRFAPLRIPLVSNVTGRVLGAEELTADYWLRHLLAPVRFEAGVETLVGQGVGVFVEVGPKPVLSELMRRIVPPDGAAVVLPSPGGEKEWCNLLASVAQLHVRNVEVDWRGFDRDYPRRRVALPTYPFERKRYWPAPPQVTGPGVVWETGTL